MIGIRVDVNTEIATGHIMRCLAIAKEIRRCSEECIFISADSNVDDFIRTDNFKSICLNSKWNNLDDEISQMKSIIDETGIDYLIVDSYYASAKYLDELKEHCKIIYIDDLHEFNSQVSILIHGSVFADEMHFLEDYAGTDTKLLLGPKYAILRPEFQSILPRLRENVTKILITFGGVDINNASGRLLEALLSNELLKLIEYHVVVGQYNPHFKDLLSVSEKYDTVFLHRNVHNMSQLMTMCDLAITAGGTTTYELCACGIPSVCVSVADNQVRNVKKFSELGVMVCAGDIRDTKCIQRIICELNYLINHREYRLQMSEKMQKLVDGLGVKRIVAEILALNVKGE